VSWLGTATNCSGWPLLFSLQNSAAAVLKSEQDFPLSNLVLTDSASLSMSGQASLMVSEDVVLTDSASLSMSGQASLVVSDQLRMSGSASLQLDGPLSGTAPLRVLIESVVQLQGTSTTTVKGRVQLETASMLVGPLVAMSGLGGGFAQSTAPQGCLAATTKSYSGTQPGYGGSHAGTC